MAQDYTENKLHVIDWMTLQRDVGILADMLKDKGPFDRIIAIARGGLIPSALLAHLMDMRVVDTICVASYDHKVQREGEPVMLKQVAGDGERCLVVDDLADTGATIRAVREMLPKAHVATVYGKPLGAPTVDTMAVAVDQSVWLVFPWDEQQ